MDANAILGMLAARGVRITDVRVDSRRITPGALFVARHGARLDGRDYVDAAVAQGAAAVLWDGHDGRPAPSCAVPLITVPDIAAISGALANVVFGAPASRLWLGAVTGTNGKTSVSQWVARALSAFDQRIAVVGTLGCGFPDALAASANTTPDVFDNHRMLAAFQAEQADGCMFEASSIGLHQGRLDGLAFDAAVFTNLSRDHLDYHGTMQAYAEAKARLFERHLRGSAVVNLDDNYGVSLARRLSELGAPVIGYTRVASNRDAAPLAQVLVAEGVSATGHGMTFRLRWAGESRLLSVRLVAGFNVSNLLATAGVLLTRGCRFADVAEALSALAPPQGRMQMLGGVGEPLVVVDYAHTPDALAEVLQALRPTARQREGRLICVFGCGGDRDRGKRPLMGEQASRHADVVVITSDNPRSESAQQIMDEIRAGAGQAVIAVPDRAEAIARTIAAADPDDVVLIAGKGHERTQEIAGVHHPFSDLDEARAALEARIARNGASL